MERHDGEDGADESGHMATLYEEVLDCLALSLYCLHMEQVNQATTRALNSRRAHVCCCLEQGLSSCDCIGPDRNRGAGWRVVSYHPTGMQRSAWATAQRLKKAHPGLEFTTARYGGSVPGYGVEVWARPWPVDKHTRDCDRFLADHRGLIDCQVSVLCDCHVGGVRY